MSVNCKYCGSPTQEQNQYFKDGTTHQALFCTNPECRKHNGFVRIVDTKDFIMPFGKHKGMTFAEIADFDRGYIVWLKENCNSRNVAERATEFIAGAMKPKEYASKH